MNDTIQYRTHNEVDKTKWNQCIDRADNGLIYAYSYYLDTMCSNWDGLILNDYEAVMPLPWRKKYGLHYLYQPAYIAQLGIFGKQISASLVNVFLQHIPARFKYLDITLNQHNFFSDAFFPMFRRVNFVLDLNKKYLELMKGYRETIRRNIKKAKSLGCTEDKDFPVQEVINLANLTAPQFNISEDDLQRFASLYDILHAQKKAITYGIRSASNELLASCVFFFSHNRSYYILVGNHPNGRTLGASHFLIDSFIRDHAGQPLLLDFEGSDIRNLAFFYSSFGAQQEFYAALKVNRLPWYIRWLKN